MKVPYDGTPLRRLATSPATRGDVHDELPFVGLEDVESGTGALASPLDKLSLRTTENYTVFKKGDILFGKLRPYLAKSFRADFRGAASTDLLIIQSNPSYLLPEFLHWMTLSAPFVAWAEATSYGVKMPRTTWEALSEFPVPVASLQEQRRIAAYLDTVTQKIDEAVGKNRTAVELLSERRASLTTRLLLRGSGTHDLISDHRAFRYLNAIPHDWELVDLRWLDVSVQTGPFGSQLHADEYVPGETPVINPAHIQAGELRPTEDSAVDEEVANRLSRHKLEPGDLVLGRRGEMGRVARVPEHGRGWLCGTGSLRLRVSDQRISSAYLAEYLRLLAIKRYLELQSVGSTMDNLNEAILRSVPVALPPRAEQQEILTRLDHRLTQLADLTLQLDQQRDLLHERRQALITAAVTGQVDVTAAERVA